MRSRGLLVSLIFFIIIFLAIVVVGAPSNSESSDLDLDSSTSSELPPPGDEGDESQPVAPLTSTRATAVVAAPDGTIYLVDISSGKVLWSFASGSSIYSAYQALPQDESRTNNSTTDGTDFYIDVGDDWELYVHGNGFEKVKLPMSVEEFLRSTPFVSSGGGIMLGSKKSTVFIVDAKNGKIIQSFCSDNLTAVENHHGHDNPILARKDAEEWVPRSAMNLDGVAEPLYVTRKDYALKFSSVKTGKILWYLMFAEIEASFQCKGIENLLGGVLYKENEFSRRQNLDTKLQLQCPAQPVVYRIRDRTSLESLFASNSLPDALPGDRVLSLPAPDLDPMLGHLDKFLGFRQNNEGDVVFALPTPESEDFGMMALPGADIGQINTSWASDNLAGPHSWFVVVYSAFVLLAVATFINVVLKKKGNSSKETKKLDSQVVTSKKKKPRKSGINYKSSISEKKKKDFSNNQAVGDINSLPDFEGTKRSFQLDPFNVSDSPTDGRKIGRLFVSTKEIAKGSNGTVVLEGIYDGRPVAVKRLVKTHHDVALKEIQNLIASDQHPNIVRWFGVEDDQDFVYLALERCTCSLHDLILSYSSSHNQTIYQDTDPNLASDQAVRIQLLIRNNSDFEISKSNGYPSPHLLKLMRDVVRGLAHLHEIGIIHRDLKPQNVLVNKERVLFAKLSDMGISRRLSGDMSSLTNHATGYGSSGWQAPEQLRHERQTRAVDLFSLGCLLFFCTTGGKHPFGESLERDINIVNNRRDLFLIENIPEATDLISSLLHPNPELRSKATDVICHPLFWDSDKRLSFLRDASDRVELEDREKESELLLALESIGNVALGGRWYEKMDTAFINDIGRYRRYKYDSVRDLLRVIRNKLNHFRELSKEIQGILGQVPEGFDSYFSKRFPKLVIEVYKVIHLHCAEEEIFYKYFKCYEI